MDFNNTISFSRRSENIGLPIIQLKKAGTLAQLLYKIHLLLILFLLLSINSKAQSWVSEVQQDGIILKKIVSDTSIATGQPFSYTIYYTIPAGAQNVVITDVLPPSLVYLGMSINNACGTPSISAPPVNSTGGTVSLSWASIPGGCSGSISLTVQFPNGVTCPGTTVRNIACISLTLNNKKYEFCTNFLSTTAIAVNPWKINKYPLGLATVGGNCPWATGNDTVTYQICVYKNVGTTGQLNLVNGVVNEILPTGALLVGSNCGATQSGNIVTWNVGNLSANQMYNTVCCQIKIYYPLAQFPYGSTITNTATLSGGLGSPQPPCSNFTDSAKACVQKLNIQSATLNKWVYTNGQPGCAGQYLIYICNNGTTPLTFTAIDTLPSTLSNYSIGSVWPSIIATALSGNILNISGTLSPGQCAYIYVNFTIPSSATVNSTITNCVWLTSLMPPQSACRTFTVNAPNAQPCLWKEVCNKQNSYTPGSVFRYRLRIQNIGGLALSGVTLTDVLDPNLEYVGNPSYYTSNTWNIPQCKPNPTPNEQWNGVSLLYNNVSNTITATLPIIPATCQNIFYTNCGMYGTAGIPFYYIEFDVKVKDTSALGNIPNKFTLSGGVLGNTTESSNTVYVLVDGVVGFNLLKEVKKPNDPTFTSSLTTTAGSSVIYKLKMNSFGTAALTHITFADLLPLNSSPNDSKILPLCSNRGSQFNVSFNSIVGTPSPSIASSYNNPATLLANVNNLNPINSPGSSFSISCGSAGTWNLGLSAGNKNIATYFGPVAVGTSGAEVQFSATVDQQAKPKDIACNTFAASGWTKHLIQSSILSYQKAGELESVTACVKIDTVTSEPQGCIKVLRGQVLCIGKDPSTGYYKYSISVTATSCVPSTLLISSLDGTFSPTSFTLTSSPWTINTNFIHTSSNNPITIYYTLLCSGLVCRDSIKLDLPPCGGQDPSNDCCRKFIHIIKDPKLTWNSGTGFVGLSVPMIAGPTPIKRFSATIVSAQLRKVCGQTVSSWQRIFGDITGGSVVVPPGPGPQLLSIYSREAVWGPVSPCVDWNKNALLDLKMIFPPYSGGKNCRDTLRFAIRYSFTDCECITCDTVIYYTIVRKFTIIPWDPDINLGFGRTSLSSSDDKDELQAEKPSKTSLIMNDINTGSLWVINPDDPENDIIIKGIEVTSSEVNLVSIKNGSVDGIVEGEYSYVNANVASGESAEIQLRFNNSKQIKQFRIFVKFIYVLKGSDELIYSDPIPFIARVPGVKGDQMGVDKNTRPANVRTYSIYLHNRNEYQENIAAFAVKPDNNTKIIAIGPPNSKDNELLLLPVLQEDGSYYIVLPFEGSNAISSVLPAGKDFQPIFLTVSGKEQDKTIINFRTLDQYGNEISNGMAELTDPLSGIKDNYDADNILSLIVSPNPATYNVSVSFSLKEPLINASLHVRDMYGRIVKTLYQDYHFDQGTHILSFDLNELASGLYLIELSSDKFIKNEGFIISK
jgi:uncharacterized repeat protein (TIGR01451 family)